MDLDEAQGTNENSNGTVQFRVKDVSEINSTTSLSTQKRKLPQWLSSSPSTSSNCSESKKPKNSNEIDPSQQCLANSSTVSLPAANEPSESKVNNEDATADGSIENIQTEDSVHSSSKTIETSSITIKNLEPKVVLTLSSIKTEVKEEPTDNSAVVSTASSSNAQPIVGSSVIKEEATSTTRETCKYGIRCYRRNPLHRIEEAHPGDSDYRRPEYPSPPKGTPDCPYGDKCYRRNPTHFRDFSHPPSS